MQHFNSNQHQQQHHKDPQCSFHLVSGDSRQVCSDCGVIPSTNDHWRIENWALVGPPRAASKGGAGESYHNRFQKPKAAIVICKPCLKAFIRKHRDLLRCCLGEEQQFHCPVPWLPTPPCVREGDLKSVEERWGRLGRLGLRRDYPSKPIVGEGFRILFRNVNNWEAVDDPKQRAAKCEKLAVDAHANLMDQIHIAVKKDQQDHINDWEAKRKT